jgi:hypothetical protein
MLAIRKDDALPLTLAGLGVGYFALTHLQGPLSQRPQDLELWDRHKRDAKVALVAGLGAGALLWWMRSARPEPQRDSFA